MLPEKAVIDRIKWDKQENINNYTVGYWDRIDKCTKEIPLKDFLNEDIPLHRIRLFKRNGKIVWDRNTKKSVFG